MNTEYRLWVAAPGRDYRRGPAYEDFREVMRRARVLAKRYAVRVEGPFGDVPFDAKLSGPDPRRTSLQQMA